MNKTQLIIFFMVVCLNISAESEIFKSCLSGERESSAKEANSFSCIESENQVLSAWCAKMAEANNPSKKYIKSGKSCKELGFLSKPKAMQLGNSYNCNFSLPKFNECKENTKQILNQLIQF